MTELEIKQKFAEVTYEDIEEQEKKLTQVTAGVNKVASSAETMHSMREVAEHILDEGLGTEKEQWTLLYMLGTDLIKDDYYILENDKSEFIGRELGGYFSEKKIEEAKKIVENYLDKGKKVCKTNLIKLLKICGDFGVYTDKLKNKVLVDLPEDNVGPLYVEPEYKDIMFKLNDLTNDLYNFMYEDGNEALLDKYDCAGFEILGTLRSLFNIKCQAVESGE